MTYLQTYNAENRIASIQKLASGTCSAPGNLTAKWDFTYDGDGVRTGQSYTPYTDGQPGSIVITRYYFGGAYETTGTLTTETAWKKYYSFAGQTVAMRDADGFKYFLSDHLGSVSVVLDENGGILEQQRYLPFGQPRETPPYASVTSTDFTYTGQRDLPDTGLMDYRARFYSPTLGRFIQPDTIIPGAENPQSWNRYSYVINNPLGYADPTGHVACRTRDECNDAGMNPGDSRLRRAPKPDRRHGGEADADFVYLPPAPAADAQAHLTDWSQPDSWDLDPHHPDYYTLSLSYKIVTTSLIVDRYSQVYWTFGGSLNSNLIGGPAGISLTGGRIGSRLLDTTQGPIPQQLNIPNFLKGLTVNFTAGLGPSGGVTFSPGTLEWVPELYAIQQETYDVSPIAFEVGGSSPFIGGAITYGSQIKNEAVNNIAANIMRKVIPLLP